MWYHLHKSWFDPIVDPLETEDNAAWEEVDPRGNSHVRKWKRPETIDHWNSTSGSIYLKNTIIFIPMIVFPLIAGFWHPMQRNEQECHRGARGGGNVCKPVGYYFGASHIVLIISAMYYFTAMILELNLMAKNRLHPWMYITIYTIGVIFPIFLFPTHSVIVIKKLTWTFAIIEWTVCAACIIQGMLVARTLARERRSKRQVEADALFAESLYQDDEREGREGELLLIDEEDTNESTVTPGE